MRYKSPLENNNSKLLLIILVVGIPLNLLAGCSNSHQRESISVQHLPVHVPVQHLVEITGFEFIPAEVNVQAGDTITWVNRDVVPHNVVNIDDQKALTPDLMKGEEFTYRATHEISYKCGLHPSMVGEVTISR